MSASKSKEKNQILINASSNQQLPAESFGPLLDYWVTPLRRYLNATDDELNYVRYIRDLQTQAFESSLSSPDKHASESPSIVIDDFLYHGSLGHASNIDLLNQLGIRHIINVSDSSLDKKIADHFHVLWINLRDQVETDIKKHFDETNQFLYECKQKNEKVLVHCQMGISRSSTIVLAYLMKYHHDSFEKAYVYLLERRPIVDPNPSFLIQLKRYEKELRASKEIDETKNHDDKQNPIVQLDQNKILQLK